MYFSAVMVSSSGICEGVGTNFKPKSRTYVISGVIEISERLTVKGEIKMDALSL